jgi:hypothetical protein
VVFGATEIKHLGHVISERGVKILADRVLAIQQYPRPVNLRSRRRFGGRVAFYARFIPKYGEIAEVLHGLKRKVVPFVWRKEHQGAYETLKRALCEAPVLQVPDFSEEFVTNDSEVAFSAVLQQRVECALAPTAYYSRVLTAVEKKYSTYEKECLAVVWL